MMILKVLVRTLLVAVLSLSAFAAAAEERRAVKLGMTASQSGEFKELSEEFLSGVKFWADDLIDRGGNRIDLVVYDDESNPEVAAQLYERLINEDQVDLLIGPFSTTLAMAVAPVAEKYNFPMVVEATAPVLYDQGYRNVFGIYTPADENMNKVMEMAVANGLVSVAVLHQESDFPAAVAAGVREQAADQGLTMVFDGSYPTGAANLDAVVEQLSQTSPDLIIVGAYLDDSVQFVQSLKKTGYAPKMLAISGAPSVAEFGERLGSDADGVIATTQWMRDGRIPGSFDFGYRYRERYGRYPSYNAAGGYAAGQILEAAARLAGVTIELGPEAVRDGIREELSRMKFQSLLGNYRVKPTGEQSGNPIYVIQWQWPYRSLIAPEDIARWTLKFPYPDWNSR